MKATLLIKMFFASFIGYACFCFPGTAQQKHSFTLGRTEFLLDGKPFRIISGEIHPNRIPREYWQHRIRMAKAMGCNTIAIYLFWNYYEQQPGIYDFSSGNRDFTTFIKLCQQEGLYVLLRPGPYCCGEWDLGGIPLYLLAYPDIKLRCMDPRYMSAVRHYLSRMAEKVKPLLCTNGGPILMIQIENEYGSYGNDKTYMEALRKIWLDHGINIPFYTADGATPYMLEAGNIDGAAIGLDPGANDRNFKEAEKHNPNVPAFSSETYPGWLTHWGEKWGDRDSADFFKQVQYLLDNNKSFNLYIVAGGTNFGFTAGANSNGPTSYQPDVTSYDYAAPINEQGQPTYKYFRLRDMIAKATGRKLPDIPQPVPAIAISPVALQPYATVWDNLPKPVRSPQPKPMEDFGQYAGLVLYRTKLIGHKSGKLSVHEPHDYAMIYLNNKLVDTLYRDGGNWSCHLPESDRQYPELDILVEAMGHINFGEYLIDRKGITDRVTLNNMTLMNWEIYNLPLDDHYIQNLRSSARFDPDRPGYFFKGIFKLDKPGDTYIDMSNFQKGIVWVNGHNLGRYWNAGPQQRLYCPASWLRKGSNEVMVFDLHQTMTATVKGVQTLK